MINERSDKVRERELPSKTDAGLFEEIRVRFNALSIPALRLRACMAKF